MLLRRSEGMTLRRWLSTLPVEIQALRALALAARGDHAGALGDLAEAVTLACPQGYVRVFADEGTPMRALLTGSPPPGRTSR